MLTPRKAAGSTPTVGSGVGVWLGAGLGLEVPSMNGVSAGGVVPEVGEPVPQAEKASAASKDMANRWLSRIMLLEVYKGNGCQDKQEDDQHQDGQSFTSGIELGDLVKRLGVGSAQQEDEKSPQPPAAPEETQ